MKKIIVQNKEINLISINKEDYICMTDIAKTKENQMPDQVIQNWLRNKHTIDFLGVWEKIYNSNFKPLEFEGIKNKSGSNSFILTPTRWIEKTNAKGIIVKRGRLGGTYAQKYIALAFASWISPEFELYLVSEFDRLKEKENKIDWNIKRTLTKINYNIHTNAIKENLVPREVSELEKNQIYSSEADLLNIALFGITSKKWKEENNLNGNIRDYANVAQLVCLSNLESLNSVLIKNVVSQKERLTQLNQVAISQMKILVGNENVKKLE